MSTHALLASSSRRPCVPTEFEIVDDSEPERIESLKKQLRTSAETLHSPSIIAHNNNLKHVDVIPVIEISDSDSQSAISSSKYTKMQDIDVRSPDQVQSTILNYKLPKPSFASTSHMQFPAAMHNPSGEHESFRGSSKINLDHFVFKSSRTSRNLQVSTEPTPSTGSAVPNSTAKGLKQKRLLSASDVDKILRCVCCNVQWTTRKSGAQKMTHIQSCAKKHALDSETINVLIQKQISLEEPFVKKTLFENVLVDAAPKQKVKRRKKEGSLKTVATSRASILARARGILSTSADDGRYQNGSTVAGSTQGHSEVPSTQAFGSSGLAQMQNFESNTFSLDGPGISDDSSDQGGIEAQPTFLASCLASHPLKVFGDYEPDREGTQSTGPSFGDKPKVETNYTLNPKLLSPSSIEGREMTSSRVPRTPTPDSSPELLSILTNLTIQSPAPTLKSKKIRKAVAKGRLNVSHSDERTLLADGVTPEKKKGPSKNTLSKIDHEEWQLRVMRNIMLDTDLHLRILRYEPIHFNVFLEIAMRYAPPISKLNQHLRTFLDDQAIIFYVNEGGRSRR